MFVSSHRESLAAIADFSEKLCLFMPKASLLPQRPRLTSMQSRVSVELEGALSCIIFIKVQMLMFIRKGGAATYGH
jgi:hypothetical protein